MNETTHSVTHRTNEMPTGLKTAAELANSLGTMSEERIIELADAGYMPHWRIDGGAPLFTPAEVKKWIAGNLMARCEGMALPTAIRVVVPANSITEKPPTSIEFISELQQLPPHGYLPGVYFLCDGNEVIYVGKSVTPSTRIATHVHERRKKFDRVYLLPVPLSELEETETAFIQLLMPSENGRDNGGRIVSGPITDFVSKKLEDLRLALTPEPTCG